jgi:hypothetical protein
MHTRNKHALGFTWQVRITSLSPLGGYTTAATTIDVIGANFVDTTYMMLQFGEGIYFCAQNAPVTVCPNVDTYTNNAVTFLNMYVVRFTVPTSPIATRRIITASNNNQVTHMSCSLLLIIVCVCVYGCVCVY